MEDSEEVQPVRKTRSGRAVRSAAAASAAAAAAATPPKRAKPCPASKKTKKRVVLMEVEVTDEEENTQPSDGESPKKAAKVEPKVADKSEDDLLKSDEELEEKKESKGEEKEEDEEKEEERKGAEAANGNAHEEEEVVLNDIEMLEGIIQTNEKIAAENSVEETKEEEKEETVEEPEKKDDSEEEEKEKEEPPAKVDSIIEKMEVEEDEKPAEKTEEEKESKKTDEETKSKIEKKVEEDEVKPEEDESKQAEDETKSEEVEKKEEPSSDKKEEKKAESEEKKEETKTEEIEEKVESPKKKPEQNGDPDAENISEDELPSVQVVKVPETEEVSDEELPGPKRAELPADTEVVSEDELPTVKKDEEEPSPKKKESSKRKLGEGDYNPDSPTSEGEQPSKKAALSKDDKEKEKEEKPPKPKKLPELDKYWKAVNDDPTDFTGWTYLLQYVDQENDMEAAREAYDAFLSHYPYCYGYWRKYADYEKRKGNKKKCEEVFERGLKAIPLSVDLWIHYLTYVRAARGDDEPYVRSQFERALAACGLEFRSDRLWDSYVKWETEGKRLQKVTEIYDRLLATPTQGYTTHFDNFQEHIASNSPNKVVEVDEFLALRKEVRHMLKHDVTSENPSENADVPPGDEDSKLISSDEETKCIRERIVSIRRKIHKNTVNAVTARWNYEEGIKRPYFHVKPLERCQLKNWHDYLDFEVEQGDKVRIIVLFERCLIACALYEEFWLKFVHYLETLNDPEMPPKIRDVYERACTIHHLKKPNLHLQWAMFEEGVDNVGRAAEILVNLEKSVPNVLQVAYRRINLERRRGDNDKCIQLFEHYIGNSKNKMIASNISIKFSRFCLKVLGDMARAQEVLRTAITKDPNSPRLYLQLIDLTLQKEDVREEEVVGIIDEFLEKEGGDVEQKILFAQRKLEYLEDFGKEIGAVQRAQEQYQKLIKQNKESGKKSKDTKSESSSSSKKEKSTAQASSASGSYNYNYGNSGQASYPYSGSQQGQYNYSQYGQGDQYQYQNWQYPQGSYGGYNQWGGYGGGYGY